jgi:hypothetical protein
VLVEFAAVLPVLLMIVVGIIDFGMLFRQQQVIVNAAREGARLATMPGFETADVEFWVEEYLEAGGVDPDVAVIDPARERITPPQGAAFNAWKVRVEVPYTFRLLGPVAGLVGGSFGTLTLFGESVMRVDVAAAGVASP